MVIFFVTKKIENIECQTWICDICKKLLKMMKQQLLLFIVNMDTCMGFLLIYTDMSIRKNSLIFINCHPYYILS